MKKVFKTLLIVALLIVGLVLWWNISCSFYCVGSDKCITVWKTSAGCYIVPGKYYGLMPPSDNFIKTTNEGDITVYWSAKLVNSMLIRCESEYEIVNNNKKDGNLIDYQKNPKFRELVYGTGAKRFNEVESDVDYISIDIKEDYVSSQSNARR